MCVVVLETLRPGIHDNIALVTRLGSMVAMASAPFIAKPNSPKLANPNQVYM